MKPLSITLSLAVMSLLPAGAAMTNRWSFGNANGTAPAGTVIIDTVGAQNGVVVGSNASFASGALSLSPTPTTGNQTPAAISAYVDLPNGLISNKTNFTLEIWATPGSVRDWQRLADFGSTNVSGSPTVQGAGASPGEILPTATAAPSGTSSVDNIMLVINRGTAANTQKLAGRNDGAGEIGMDSTEAIAAPNPYYFVIRYTAGAGAFGAAGGQLAWFRNGTLVRSVDLNFPLSAIQDVNNWLGRSQYSNDSNAHISYDEVRLYNHAMSASEITASYAAGPNPAYPAPVAVNDALTMHRGQKARIEVLTNDSGVFNPTTVTILQAPQFGTAVPDSTGRILYTQVGGSPASDSFIYRINGPGGNSAPATVTVTFASSLRISNTTLNVPLNPPPVSIQAIEAFPGLIFNGPTCLSSPPGDTQRLFVCTKGGTLWVIPNVTAASPTATTVLTLSAAVGGLFNGRVPAESLSTNSEQGLLGIAFHPNFATNGYLFFFYSVTKSGGTYERISRITLNNPTSTTPTANLSSELVLIEQLDQYGNHNGGDLHFGPDGYLYISLGDEGNQDDEGLNSQRIDKDFFSGILRIDVNREGDEIAGGNPSDPDDTNIPPNAHAAIPLSGGKPAFEIPSDNPFIGATSFNGIAVTPTNVRTEFWAVGLRNPWRFSFDINGELWCGDVGGGVREEIDLITRGGNYGWVYREGTVAGPWAVFAHPAPPGNFSSINPIHDYAHGSGPTQGNSVSGGFVYRGTRVPSLTGAYIYADYTSGNVWSLVRNGANPPTVTRILGESGVVAFAPDPSNGDVLMADHTGNRILRIATVSDTSTYPATLSATKLFADMTDLAPAPSVLPYDINSPFWSDHAVKRRWFTVPDAVSTMSWSRDGMWTFPTGQIWVKHFDLETTRGNPATKKRIETRVFVRNAGGAYGVSYRWNNAGTEASLVSDAGDEFDVNITVGGSPYTQRWSIPSRAQCVACHTPQAGHALSFNTRQVNLTNSINGFSGNQLDLLESAGYFSNSADSPNLLPFHLDPDDPNFPVEARVRSYLAVNCSYCHKPGGTAAPSAWDGRHEIPLDQTGLINGTATNNGGNALNKLIVPGDLAHSVVYNRVAVANGFTRMPPIGSNELDPKAIVLLTEWIQQALPAKKTYAQWRLLKFNSAFSPEGESGADPDGDGKTNREEYLAATEPLLGSSYFKATFGWVGNQAKIDFLAPTNQSAQVETSANLVDWTLWDVPGNEGVPQLGGSVSLQGPVTGASKFFRVKLQNN